MTVDITALTNQIHAAGYSAIVEQDLRGSLARGPVNIAITRNNSTFTHLHLLTLSPLRNHLENTTHYFITHVTIDQAITLRIPKTMTAQELWHHIYDTRLKTIPTPKPYLKQRHYDAPPIQFTNVIAETDHPDINHTSPAHGNQPSNRHSFPLIKTACTKSHVNTHCPTNYTNTACHLSTSGDHRHH